MNAARFPEKLANLHFGEEHLREKALKIVEADPRVLLHLGAIEHAMDLADVLRQFETDNEDLRLVQVLGIRRPYGIHSITMVSLMPPRPS